MILPEGTGQSGMVRGKVRFGVSGVRLPLVICLDFADRSTHGQQHVPEFVTSFHEASQPVFLHFFV
jgi:hypothetical protein